jgi:hypothetical protein
MPPKPRSDELERLRLLPRDRDRDRDRDRARGSEGAAAGAPACSAFIQDGSTCARRAVMIQTIQTVQTLANSIACKFKIVGNE